MASRIIAQLIVAGGAAFFRAASQAWRQAIINGQKAGLHQEGAQAASGMANAAGRRLAGKMSYHEANMILGISETTSWDEVLKRYDHLMKVNEDVKSFYLQSKVYRAKERIMLERGIEESDDPRSDPKGFAAAGAAEGGERAEGAENAEGAHGGEKAGEKADDGKAK